MPSRSLHDLAAPVRAAAESFLRLCSESGLHVLIYCTLRTVEEQAELYGSGRSRPGPVLTNARPGQSLHNPDILGKAWAFDAVPLWPNGAAAWDDLAAIEAMGACGERAGLDWAGRWQGSMRERVHFQMSRGGKNA